jgi:hypothetical protein
MGRLEHNECICGREECWGYTCPVHRTVNRGAVPYVSSRARSCVAVGVAVSPTREASHHE